MNVLRKNRSKKNKINPRCSIIPGSRACRKEAKIRKHCLNCSANKFERGK